MKTESPEPTTPARCEASAKEESVLYARVLRAGVVAGLVCMAITYAVYALGIIEPRIPLEKLSAYYGMPAEEYLDKAGIQPGWSDLADFRHADSLSYLGIIMMAGITIVCYGAVLPLLLKRGDRIYAAMAVLEIVVLVLAASGMMTGGR